MSRGGRSKAACIYIKTWLFKVLDYDPDVTNSQLSQRFGISVVTAQNYRIEWKEARANED